MLLSQTECNIAAVIMSQALPVCGASVKGESSAAGDDLRTIHNYGLTAANAHKTLMSAND